MPIDVSATIAGLAALGQRVNVATERIVARAAHEFQAQAMINAPVGEPDNSTNEPGDLRRSIEVDGPESIGDHTWFARVGPTVVTANPGPGGSVYNYGRQREFGGLLWAKSSPFLAFWTHGTFVRKLFVYQFGSHYLGRARSEVYVDGIVVDELTVAIEGG